jgi:hypothetical protein
MINKLIRKYLSKKYGANVKKFSVKRLQYGYDIDIVISAPVDYVNVNVKIDNS